MPEIYDPNATPDETQHDEVYISPEGNYESQHVVQDTAAQSRLAAYKLSQFIWLIFGILEGLILVRIILRLIAANPTNPFAAFIYGFTDLFLWPFYGLTYSPSVGGMVLEIPSIIGMIIYGLIAWVLVKVVWLVLYRNTNTVVQTYRDRRY